MKELLDLLAGRNQKVSLDVAALQIATIEHPDLSLEPFLALLDSHANELGERVDSELGGEEFIELLVEYMVEELGFRGNQNDYYHPGNSCLNDVLANRVGIPITLSVVYIEIARRLGRPIHGIGLPGHFLVQYDDGEFTTFLDPFHDGTRLTGSQCFELAQRVTGQDLEGDYSILRPVSNRHIAIRMLNNLRAVYVQKRELGKLDEVLTLLIEAEPRSADGYRQRAICRAQLKNYKGSRSDFETYLKLAPHAPDRQEIEKKMELLKHWIADLN